MSEEQDNDTDQESRKRDRAYKIGSRRGARKADTRSTGFKPKASWEKRDLFLSKLQLEVKARAQRGHLQLALRAFVRLEAHWLQTGTSWYQAKTAIIRSAVRDYLAHPLFTLASDPTA